MPKQNTHNLYLVGPLGSGKTSVGKCLAEQAKLDLYDSDTEIEHRTGVDVSWIFEQEGEPGFRQREADVIRELTQLNNIVLSTGGGAVVTKSNRQQLADNGIVIYLQVSVDEQLERTKRKKHTRPMLQRYNTKEKLEQLNQTRDPLYREIADLIYKTDRLSPKTLAIQILKDVHQLKEK